MDQPQPTQAELDGQDFIEYEILDEPFTCDGLHPRYKKNPPKIVNDKVYIPLFGEHSEVVDWSEAPLDLFESIGYKFCFYRMSHWSTPDKYYAVSNKKVLMHHLFYGKPPPGFVSDHANGNGLDNSRENSRYLSYAQNAQNKAKKPGFSSIYTGVHKPNKPNSKWIAAIQIQGDKFTLGRFDDELTAAKVYDAHAVWYYCYGAHTNGLLSDEVMREIQLSKTIPEEYLRYTQTKKDYDLPTGISRDNGKYKVKMMHDKKTFHNKCYDTLQEAIVVHKDCLIRREKLNIEKRLSEPILRNEEGHLMIQYTNNKGETFTQLFDDMFEKDIRSLTWSGVGPYARNTKNNFLMHEYVWKLANNFAEIPEGMSIDHIDPTRQNDNRICNLRLACSSLQNHNKMKKVDSKYLYRGYYSADGKFRVDKGKNWKEKKNYKKGDRRYVSFETEEEAANEVNKINIAIWDDKATLNIIDFTKRTTVTDRIPVGGYTKEYINSLQHFTPMMDLVRTLGLHKPSRKKGGLKFCDFTGDKEQLEKCRNDIIRVLKL